jgi:hypothetical protein
MTVHYGLDSRECLKPGNIHRGICPRPRIHPSIYPSASSTSRWNLSICLSLYKEDVRNGVKATFGKLKNKRELPKKMPNKTMNYIDSSSNIVFKQHLVFHDK